MTEWWETLKEGDILFWTLGKWRYKGFVEYVNLNHKTVMVNQHHRFTKADCHDGEWVGPQQEHESWVGETRRVAFTTEMLQNEGMEWMHTKTADIRIRVRDTVSGRDFRIWGEGDGIPDANGQGGGLRYRSTEEPLST